MNPYAAELEEAHERERIANERIRALEAHLKKAHESEDRAMQAVDKAEADLASVAKLVLEDHRVGTDGYGRTQTMARKILSQPPGGRESGAKPTSRGVGSSPEVRGAAAANPPGETTDSLINDAWHRSAAKRRRDGENQECGT